MENGHFSPDIEEFLLAFHRHQVRFLIVGGEAVIFYGYPRLTGDLDLYFDGSKENTQRLYKALEEFWGGSAPGLSDESEPRVVGVVAQFGVPPNRVDLMNQLDGVSFSEAWKGRTVDSAVLGGKRFALPEGSPAPAGSQGLETSPARLRGPRAGSRPWPAGRRGSSRRGRCTAARPAGPARPACGSSARFPSRRCR
jgi:hypothetical protein